MPKQYLKVLFVVVLILFVLVVILAIILHIKLRSKIDTNLRSTIRSSDLSSSDSKNIEPKIISIESQITNLEAKIIEKDKILALLKNLELWTGKKKIYETKSAFSEPFNKLHIVLTDKKQEFNQVISRDVNDTLVYQSTGAEYDFQNKQLNLYLHIDSKFISEENPTELGQIYSYMVIKRIYGIKNDISLGQDSEYTQKNTLNFIQIEKNEN